MSSVKLAEHPIRSLKDSLFPLDGAWVYGYKKFEYVDRWMDGWIVSNPFDVGSLAQMVKNAGNGNHLEIGTAWGGSAIMAALVKRRFGLDGQVVAFDPIRGLDVVLDRPRSLEVIDENFRRFGVTDQIELVADKFDVEWVASLRFSSVLIDGSHRYDDVLRDWLGVRQVAERYVMFHDYDYAHHWIRKTVEDNMDGWRLVHLFGSSLILERIV